MKDQKKFTTHKEKCHQFFAELQRGKKFYISVDQPLSRIESSEGEEPETWCVNVTILTQNMLAYDARMFEDDSSLIRQSDYRAYFAGFTASVDEKMARKLEALSDGWYIGYFTNFPNGKRERGFELEGMLVTSASPVNVWDGKYLVFTDERIDEATRKKINVVYKWADPNVFVSTLNSDVEKELKKAWDMDSPNVIDIYNVGHGNADYIRGSEKRILYDVGYNYRSSPNHPRFSRAAKAIRRLKPSCVILSHWDMDHILGCAYAERTLFDVPWVAPQLTSQRNHTPTINAARLARYLHELGNLILVDRDQGRSLIATIDCRNNQKIKLWLGGGVDTHVRSAKNCEGLLLEICSAPHRPHILLAGDVPYSCMPQNLNELTDFMHVPHHCSNMVLGRLAGLPGGGKAAIVTTNRKECNYNYDRGHWNELSSHFERVMLTICPPSKVENEAISIRINCQTQQVGWR